MQLLIKRFLADIHFGPERVESPGCLVISLLVIAGIRPIVVVVEVTSNHTLRLDNMRHVQALILLQIHSNLKFIVARHFIVVHLH